MSTSELLLIALGLSMDAFAVAVCHGLSMRTPSLKNSLIVGLYFGGFQAAMPLIGYLIGSRFADMIASCDHWIAFALLSFIGSKMIAGSFSKEAHKHLETSLRPSKMIPPALATSIDALAVGVSFAFLQVEIIPAVSFIGIITLSLSMAGVKLGNVFGTKFKSKAELAGGVILILLGLKILLEHLEIIS